jgi:hypothetical protein
MSDDSYPGHVPPRPLPTPTVTPLRQASEADASTAPSSPQGQANTMSLDDFQSLMYDIYAQLAGAEGIGLEIYEPLFEH